MFLCNEINDRIWDHTDQVYNCKEEKDCMSIAHRARLMLPEGHRRRKALGDHNWSSSCQK